MLRTTRRLAAVMLLLWALTAPPPVLADYTYVVSRSCESTYREDCTGMTWETETCSTTYSNGYTYISVIERPHYTECWTCYLIYREGWCPGNWQ